MTDWHVFAIIWKEEAGVVSLLLQDSRSINPRYAGYPPQTKFPGGGEKEGDISRFRALKREIEEETYLDLKEEDSVELVYEEATGDPKAFYLVNINSLTGQLRTETILDGTDLLSPPRFEPITRVGRMLYPTHQRAFLKVLQHFGLIG